MVNLQGEVTAHICGDACCRILLGSMANNWLGTCRSGLELLDRFGPYNLHRAVCLAL